MEALVPDDGAPPAPPAPEALVPAPAVLTNPFEVDLAAPAAVNPQKAAAAGLLLDIAGVGALADHAPFNTEPFFNNGHTNGNLYDILDASPNGKVPAASATEGDEEQDDDEEDEDDDSGNEMAAERAKNSSNPFGAAADLDLELQRQQLSDFDPENEPRHDTPTPPADDVPGVIGLVSDNVAESGEESEDEWNYYRVEPTEKPKELTVKEQQTKQEVCHEQSSKVDESDMDSQLNPNAAEFIPSPTHNPPSMEEILSQAQSSELDTSINTTISSVNTTDLITAQDKIYDKYAEELSSSEKDSFLNPLADLSVEKSLNKEPGGALDETVAISTKAECGDESTSSNTDFQKIFDGSRNIMESSLMGQDFFASEEKTGSIALHDTPEPTIQNSIFQQDVVNDFQKEPIHISFELQKEIAPQMEAQPERVKVDSEDQSPTVDSEPMLPSTTDLSESNKLVDDLDLMCSNDALTNKVPTSDDFMAVPNPVSQNVENDETVDDFTATKTEEPMTVPKSPRIDEVDLLREVHSTSFPGADVLEFSQPLEKSDVEKIAQSPVLFIENDLQQIDSDVRQPFQPSESPLSELTDDILIQQESHQLSNEISTPEYEKLEKVLEASEQFQNQFNIAKNEIPVCFPSMGQGNFASDEVLLESAHRDTVALLEDACAETAPRDIAPVKPVMDAFAPFANGLLDLSTPATALSEVLGSDIVPSRAAFDSPIPNLFTGSATESLTESVPQVDVLPTASPTPAHFDIVAQPALDVESLEAVSQNSDFIESLSDAVVIDDSAPGHIPTLEETVVESVHNEIKEATQTPPPTPLITQLADEPLNFNRRTENITEAVEKLTATQQVIEVNGLQVKDIMSDVPVNDTSDTISNSLLNQQTVEEICASATQSEDITVPEGSGVPPVDVKSTDGESLTGNLAAAAVVAGGVVAAVAKTAGVAVSGDNEVKKEKEVSAKKSATLLVKDKKPSTEKSKTAAKTAVSSRLSATTTKPKSPTSPVKPPVAQKTASRPPPSTVPNKPSPKPPITKTATRPISSASSRTTTTTTAAAAAAPVASKLKTAGGQVPAKPSVPTASLAKTRPASSPIEKKTITNGDIKAAPKRPEQLSAKTSTKVSQRPATAPATRTVSKTTSTLTTAVTKAKAPLNGPSKPRPLSSVTQVKTASKASNEKEIKDTANKQISTRTTTSTVRSTTTTMASKTSVTSASRRIESKVLTNGKGPATKPSSLVKTTTTTTASSRILPKKPATATRVKTAKSESIVEKSETVQGSKTVIAVNE